MLTGRVAMEEAVEKATTDEEKGRTLEEMSNLVRILNSKIADKKEILAPLLRGI